MIYSIGTKVQSGKGGISTAIVGFATAKPLLDKGVKFISSHDEEGGKVIPFFKAFKTVLCEVKKDDVVWLHCGRWLSMLRKLLLAGVAKMKGAKVVFHFHADVTADYLDFYFGRCLIASQCRLADGIVVLSPWWKRLLVQRFSKFAKKIEVIANPLDAELLSLVQSAVVKRQENTEIKLLAMSRLVKGKGFEETIRAMRVLPDCYSLSIAGTGIMEYELKQLVENLGIAQRVRFLGWVNYQEKAKVFQEHDIFVLPSQNDSFGMVYLEAMAIGLPVVAAKYRAIPDVVPDGSAGVLIQNVEPHSLAQAVIKCSENQTGFGNFGKCYAQTAFNKDQLAAKLLTFFETL
ncbi:glycosyltransferase family 4 protein [Lacimicrobium sp. SS2-24]|uniref:glycosyltransferase family 4 protein n=1 Tax=Lacimicrobium sp. SS2-24 TaxID=2005569 RepID=UPI000B4AA79F|nr:glycosyltransferase family 4 protein [Lacimicrobium sp. SS2-24]